MFDNLEFHVDYASFLLNLAVEEPTHASILHHSRSLHDEINHPLPSVDGTSYLIAIGEGSRCSHLVLLLFQDSFGLPKMGYSGNHPYMKF
jgi:hypothetical protein